MIKGTTRIAAVYGWPVEHSFSPVMHNAAFQALGMDCCYVACAVPLQLVGDAVRAVRALGMMGANVTIPHKSAVVPFLDELELTAAALNVVNTIHNDGGRLVGYNTDVEGFLRSLRGADMDPKGLDVLVIGAGGASRGVCYALATAGAKSLVILNRTPARAAGLADLMKSQVPALAVRTGPLTPEALAGAVPQAALIVHTSSYGMYPDHEVPSLVPPELLRAEQSVCDIVFNPVQTSLVRAAESRGCKAIGGLLMLVYQGAIAFEKWTGLWPPTDVMEQAALGSLSSGA